MFSMTSEITGTSVVCSTAGLVKRKRQTSKIVLKVESLQEGPVVWKARMSASRNMKGSRQLNHCQWNKSPMSWRKVVFYPDDMRCPPPHVTRMALQNFERHPDGVAKFRVSYPDDFAWYMSSGWIKFSAVCHTDDIWRQPRPSGHPWVLSLWRVWYERHRG